MGREGEEERRRRERGGGGEEESKPTCKAFALYVLLEHVGPWLPSYEDI